MLFVPACIPFDPVTNFTSGGVRFTGTAFTSSRLDGSWDSDSNTKQVSFVFWLRCTKVESTIFQMSDIFVDNSGFIVNVGSTGEIAITGRKAGGTTVLGWSGPVFTTSVWTCVMASFDLSDTNKRHVYFGDDAQTGTYGNYVNDVINFAPETPLLFIGGNEENDHRFGGDMGDMWMSTGTYIDFSVEANRRKFYSSTGSPVYLGPDGSVPTGSQPELYLHRSHHASASSWATNKGSLAGFAVSFDALTKSSTNP